MSLIHPTAKPEGRRRPRVAAAVIATGSLLLGTLALAPSAEAAPAPEPAQLASSWLVDQLTGGLIHNPNFGGFDDYGLSIDTGFALDPMGEYVAEIDGISTAIATNINNYITGESFGDVGSTYAGATAKAASFAVLAGDLPTSFGGVNLQTRLEGVTNGTSPIAGRIEDVSTFGDSANTIGQGFAAEALTLTGSAEAPAAIDFLLKQQCTAGFFRLDFTADKAATDQTCDGGTAGESAPDTDVTALVVMSLLRSGDTSGPVTDAIDDATAWLLSTQGADGSWGGGTSTEGANTNSTGLAGYALGESGDAEAAADAAAYVRKYQAFDIGDCSSELTGSEGAIGYDATGYADGRTDGITELSEDQWRRATAQALPVLLYAEVNDGAPVITGPTGYVSGKSDVEFTVTGLERGERVCISGKDYAKARSAKSATETVMIEVPGKTKERRYRLSAMDGGSSTVVSVLGKADLTVKLDKKSVKKGNKQSVVVKGLADGEKIKLKFDGGVVAKGTANAKGKFKATFKVTGSRGNAKLVAKGQFPNRLGDARFEVR